MHPNSKTKTDLQVIQNKCLRCILNLPTRSITYSIHNALKMDKLDARISNLCTKYLKTTVIRRALSNKPDDCFKTRSSLCSYSYLKFLQLL